MPLKLSKNMDEVCYPFIQETSYLCDFEVLTDELCALIGAVLAYLPDGMADIREDLQQLQPLAFHLNGSVRGRLAVEESDLSWLNARLDHYRNELQGQHHRFVLPRGDVPVPQLNQARSAAKKAIRALVRVDEEGKEVAPILPRLCNLMCNFFFYLTLVLNQRRGFIETEFVSKSYGPLR